jgi:ubiquinone/menaquinone biosynthesis C-methylase UbiE
LNHNDHVGLLRGANLPRGGVWADLGAGTGAFTLALRELVGPEATLCAIDNKRRDLEELEAAFSRRFEDVSGLRVLQADFTHALQLPPLDGVLMANSLHFVRDKVPVLEMVRQLLKPRGMLLVVEYNADRGNAWVPHPFSFKTFSKLAEEAGFVEPQQIARHPSNFLREFYSASARNA